MASVQTLAHQRTLGALLDLLAAEHGGWSLLDHWTQGEFHHDVVIRMKHVGELPGSVLVVATNCNGGVKEVLAFEALPDRQALWRHRCPGNTEFAGASAPLAPILGHATTEHWFDPCVLLASDARSELRPEHRQRQPGGGWCKR